MPDAGSPKAEIGDPRERRKRPQLKSGGRKRRASPDSPDSVILYSSDHCSGSSSGPGLSAAQPSSGSRFSSTSRSAIDRCSFGSDHDPLSPHLSFAHLALLERCSGGNGPNQGKMGRILSSSRRSPIGSVEKAEKISQEERQVTVSSQTEECRALDKKSHSSPPLRECLIRRHKSEVLSLKGRKPRRQRPASLDLNIHETDLAVFSPRILPSGIVPMKKNSGTSSHSRSQALPSPNAANHPDSSGAVGCQKSCSSERVPPPANNSRRYMGAGFNNGRILPSKWEDAEKWIFSPISTEGVGRPLPPVHHRRPKSKSGPLGPPGFSPSSPIAPYFDSGRVGSFTGSSPFLAGVLVADRGICDSRRGGIGGAESTRSSSANAEPYILRSASIHGCSETLPEPVPSLENSQNEKFDCIKGGTKSTSLVVLRKDVAIQMSPQGSTHSSPKHSPSFPPSPLVVNAIEMLESRFPKLSVRDVQVDDQVTVTRWTKKQIARGFDKRPTSIIEWKKKMDEIKASSFVVSDTKRGLSKVKRDEDKISAWEHLQKAKAEAAIRELEMKLEKRRSSSMNKILKQLRSAQKKAEEMRSSATSSQKHQVAKTTKNSRPVKISSLSGCFTCHAF